MLKVVHDAEASNENTTGAAGGSLLDEVVRDGARQMLASALQAEVTAYVEQFIGEVDEQGHRLVVRNGYHAEREVITAAGAVPVRQPRVNDRRTDEATGAEVRLEVFETAYDIAGGGRFGDKAAPSTKEQADYNLKYLAAVALIDGQVGPDQLREERVQLDDVQNLIRRVEVVADESLTAGYPLTTPVRVHLGLTDGRRWSREQTDFEGAATRPLSWDRVVQKFHWLTEPYADDRLRADIIAAVADLDTISIALLTALLARVRLTRERPRTHHPV